MATKRPKPKPQRRAKTTRPAAPRARRPRRPATAKTAKTARRPSARKTAARPTGTPARATRPRATPAEPRPPRTARPGGRKKIPVGLLRERRRLAEEPTPVTAREVEERRYSSAALSGREDLLEKLLEHTETGPEMTGGDLDADWERAYSSGDEAPGGDNPTPDQALVDDYGKALGIHYDDNEELRLGEKEAERDRHRWELDPASAEDYQTRDEE